MKIFASLAFLAFTGSYQLVCQTSQGSVDLAVRLVYLKDGRFAAGQSIILFQGKPSSPLTPRTAQVTNSRGVATFHLFEPLPEKVWVYNSNGRIEGCSRQELSSLHDVLVRGVTVGRGDLFGPPCKGDDATIARLAAKPGELVIFVRKISVWENLRHY